MFLIDFEANIYDMTVKFKFINICYTYKFNFVTALHISEVTLRHFVGIFLKVATLEELKLLLAFSK